MRTIYKYPLNLTDTQQIKLPKLAECLTVQMQQGHPCMWAIVDPAQPTEVLTVHLVGTGHPVPSKVGALQYLGTVQDAGFVWHFFLEGRR
jgi:hypothetical protein